MNPPASSPLLRAAAFLSVVALGVALVASARGVSRPGPRLSRRADLVDLIERESGRTRELRARLDRLAADLRKLQSGSEGQEGRMAAIRDRIDALAPLAGLAPVRGPGVVVVLRDSKLRESPTGDPNDLVVHEQDLQAVVNGLWAAGAEAISVSGERITSLSAIRCVGNTLLLHGSVYSPPYRIEAIGNPARLMRAFAADPLVERVRVVAEHFGLGFETRRIGSLSLPAFRGVLAMRFAERTA